MIPDSNKAPVATTTIARIYMSQGKLDQAETILRDLLARRPDDLDLKNELAEVQHRREIALAQSVSTDLLNIEVHNRQLTFKWDISEAGETRARILINDQCKLILRIAGFPFNDSEKYIDMTIPDRCGTAICTAPDGAVFVAASVGLLGKQNIFVSITHCDPVQLN